MKTRLAKFIADSGIASRRDAERLIESGVVTVNGVKITTPVFFVDGTEEITVDGKLISNRRHESTPRIFVFHKPINTMTTTRDPMGRKTIYDVMKQKSEIGNQKLIYVGRLDYKTTGLLLLTDDGELARKLTLPSSNIERTYIATVSGNDLSGLDRARAGITVDGIKYRPMKIDVMDNKHRGGWAAAQGVFPRAHVAKHTELQVTITEGKKNEVRIVLAAVGLPVSKLHRISYGPVKLGNLSVGEIIELPQKTVDLMIKSF